MLHNGRGWCPASHRVDARRRHDRGGRARRSPRFRSFSRAFAGWGALGMMIYATSAGAIVAFVVKASSSVLRGRLRRQRLLQASRSSEAGPGDPGAPFAPATSTRCRPSFGGAYGAASMAQDRIGTTGGRPHPDWQASYDEAVSGGRGQRPRQPLRVHGTPEHDRACSETVRWHNQIGEIMDQRNEPCTAAARRQRRHAGLHGLLHARALVNGGLLFTQGGPLHDRLLRIGRREGGGPAQPCLLLFPDTMCRKLEPLADPRTR